MNVSQALNPFSDVAYQINFSDDTVNLIHVPGTDTGTGHCLKDPASVINITKQKESRKQRLCIIKYQSICNLIVCDKDKYRKSGGVTSYNFFQKS